MTRALGPRLGWTTGFAIFAADVIVMATLSEIAGKYLFILIGWQSAASSTLGLAVAATMFIALMTWVAYRGVELSARVQQALLGLEVTILAAVRRGRAGQGLHRRARPARSTLAGLAEPVLAVARRAGRRRAARRVRVLGLGCVRDRERGVARTRRGARAGRRSSRP